MSRNWISRDLRNLSPRVAAGAEPGCSAVTQGRRCGPVPSGTGAEAREGRGCALPALSMAAPLLGSPTRGRPEPRLHARAPVRARSMITYRETSGISVKSRAGAALLVPAGPIWLAVS